MAELIRTQRFRTQVQNVPGAATPSVSFGQRRPEIAFQAQANYQNNIAQAIDRMSNTLFGLSETFGQEAGQQFALENSLTQEQLQAMSRGDMSTVNLGSPMNVFSSMVRKVRAAELSAHMEAEARQELASIYDQASNGKISTEDAKGKIQGLLNAGGSTLSQVDPDAAYKYRASIAASGSKVIDEIGKAELKRRAIANGYKLSTDYSRILALFSSYMIGGVPADETGKELPLMEVIQAHRDGFLANAFALGGLPAMESYAAKLDQDIPQLKIDVITRGIIDKDPDIGGDAFAAMDRLRKGQAGKYQNVYNSMSPLEQSAMRVEIHKAYNEMANLHSADKAAQKQQDEGSARKLISDYFKTGNAKLLEELDKIAIKSGAISVDYVVGLPKALVEMAPSNPIAEMRLKDEIRDGAVSTLDEFLTRGKELGLTELRLADIFNYLNTADRRINAEIESDARRAAGLVPGQQNSTYRQTESYYNYLGAVDNEFAAQMEQWEAGGSKGARPTKSAVSQKITNARRTAVPSTIITSQVSDLNSKYGPSGTLRKSSITDFRNTLQLNYDQSSGMPIGLSSDAREILQRNGFNRGQIDDVEQTLMSIDLQQRSLDSIRSQQ